MSAAPHFRSTRFGSMPLCKLSVLSAVVDKLFIPLHSALYRGEARGAAGRRKDGMSKIGKTLHLLAYE
jgi:hypothetical protein